MMIRKGFLYTLATALCIGALSTAAPAIAASSQHQELPLEAQWSAVQDPALTPDVLTAANDSDAANDSGISPEQADSSADISPETSGKTEGAEVNTDGPISDEAGWDSEDADDTSEDDEPDMDSLGIKAENIETSTTSYQLKTLTVTKSKFVADTFNGVQALYRPGGNDGTSSTYSCAAYVKRYYSQVHKTNVYNLNTGCTPLASNGKKFQKVSAPKEGDIMRFTGHWAIVKKVNPSSKTVVLIEQNWKWNQGGSTLCKINRSVGWQSGSFFRLK